MKKTITEKRRKRNNREPFNTVPPSVTISVFRGPTKRKRRMTKKTTERKARRKRRN